MEFGALQRRGNAGNQLVQQPVQQQQVQEHGQQEGQAPQRRQAVRKVAAGTKAPKYDSDGGFDLYRARLESYLRQRDCWNVVIGTEAPDPQNAAQQQNYEERNLFARDALLFGLLPKDAKKVCKLALRERDEDDSEIRGKSAPEKKKNKKIGFMGRWTKPPGAIGMMRSSSDAVTSRQIMACSSDEYTQEWMMDTGTDVHVCTDMDSFQHELVEGDKYFNDWKGDSAKAEGIGLVQVRTMNALDPDGAGFVLNLVETRYSPNGLINLLSQELLEMDGWIPSTPFTRNPADRDTYFTNDMHEGVKLVFKKRNGHYWLDASPANSNATVCRMTSTPKENKLLLWHMRFAHQNVEALRKMVQMKMVEGMESLSLTDFRGQFRCIACQRAKQRRMAYKRQQGKRHKKCYARLMSDVCHVGVLTPGGNLYFQLVQDEASRYKWCYLLKQKKEATQNVINLILQLEKERSIYVFSCDQGKEFVNTPLENFLALHGIELLTTNSYTPEENCLVEKLNGGLMSKVRAINEAAGLPYCLWGEVLGYVVEVDNMSATKALNDITPYEKLLGTKPVVRDLHVCGSVVFHFIPKQKRKTKLDMRSDPGIFLGYAKNSLGYRILDLCTGKLIERRDVVFHEDMAADPQYVRDLINCRYFEEEIELPEHIDFVSLPVSRVHLPVDELSQGQIDENTGDSPSSDDDDNNDRFYDTDDGMAEAFVNDEVDDDVSISDDDDDSDNDFSGSGAEAMEDDVTGAEAMEDDVTTPHNDTKTDSGIGSAGASGSAGTGTASGSGKDVGNTGTDTIAVPTMASTSPTPRTPRTCMMIATVCDLLNPTSVQQALASEHAAQWKRAMDVEYESLIRNQTWVLVPRPKPIRDKPINILSSLWVLNLKRNERGEIERHKARLAIKGYRQKYGLDYLETNSPVVRIESVLLVLLLALLLGLDCQHIDFVTAFLNGVLEGVEIYMEQPEGYDDGSGRVCKLLKGLYGLKQASRIWNNTLHTHLVELEFRKCTFDAGVDVKKVVEALGKKYKIKNLGRVKYLLGMEINYVPGKILCISQTAYIERLLKKFGMADAKAVRSPQMHNEPTLRIETNPELINDPTIPFREMVGSLQYLVHCTRPDLANAVRTLGRYGGAYTSQNFRQAQRVLRYLQATKDIGLVYRYEEIGQNGVKFDAFADADHAGCPETSRSVSGWALRLNGNVWHW
ncbi:unnamed protein product [Phytophthora fragariaefolia]|uniref:Unnamed protein product n=1 Tax=Phytophthora fragariaefolia TaxID=1490495 RepID=A0A9W6TUX6_9STRA|nr:unnamed protein product [Phytophthora fragariaefolia]